MSSTAYGRLTAALAPLDTGRPVTDEAIARILDALSAAILASRAQPHTPEGRIAQWAAEHPDARLPAADIARAAGVRPADMNPMRLGRLVARGLRLHSPRWSSDSHTVDGISTRCWAGPEYVLRREGAGA